MFTLKKEDREIKKVVKKDKDIRLTKEDLEQLKEQIKKYQIKNENAIRSLARLSIEDRNYLDKVVEKYFISASIPLETHAIQTLAVVLKNGGLREKQDNGYHVDSKDCDNLRDVLETLGANASSVYLSKELGEKFAQLNENGKYGIFLHRPGSFMLVDGFCEKVFMEGIISNGDGLMAGANFSSRGKLEKTFTDVSDVPVLISQLKNACAAPYKTTQEYNKGVFLAKIPMKVLENGDPIFYETENKNMYLHPQYIDGFVNFSDNEIISYTKNNYIVPDIDATIGDTSTIHYRSGK